jgi:hypothetical protein
MSARWEQELELLRSVYPPLEYRLDGGQHWVRLAAYEPPAGWSEASVELAFRIPAQAGEAPYAFWLRPTISRTDGQPVNNATTGATPWGTDFQQFSWSPVGWQPKADVRVGANMLAFVRSISERLEEGE